MKPKLKQSEKTTLGLHWFGIVIGSVDHKNEFFVLLLNSLDFLHYLWQM